MAVSRCIERRDLAAARERLRAHLPLDDAHEQVVGDSDVDAEARERLEALQRAMQSLNAVDRALLVASR